MFRINLFKGFLYPLTSLKRLLAAWLVLPLSLAVLVPPILTGLGVLGTVKMNLQQGLGFSAIILAVCLTVGAVPFTLLAGYLLRCRKRVIAGDTTLPPWSGLANLLYDGGEMDTLALLVGLPTLALFWGGVASVAVPLKNLVQDHTWTSLLWALVGSGAGLACLAGALVLWLCVAFLSPMATLRLARGLGVVAAIQPKGIFSDIRRGWFDYLLCCVLMAGLSVAFSMLQAAFWPLVVVSFPMQVYLQLVWAHLLGQYALAYFNPDER